MKAAVLPEPAATKQMISSKFYTMTK